MIDIKDIKTYSDSELDHIFNLVNNERINRKLDKLKQDIEPLQGKKDLSKDYEYYNYCLVNS